MNEQNRSSNSEQLGLIRIETPKDRETSNLLRQLIDTQAETNKLLSRLLEEKDSPETFSQRAAAKFLGLSPATLYDLVSKGRIKCHKAGSKNIFKRKNLEEYLQEREDR